MIAPRAVLVVALTLAACSAPGDGGPNDGPDDARLAAACADAPPLPEGLTLDSFYEVYCLVEGVPIVASAEVPDDALRHARALLEAMLARVPDAAITAIEGADVRIGIIAEHQVTTDLPEHADLNEAFPGTDWDADTRGVAATATRPLTSAAEENVLCYPDDVYAGESILIHEFAHTVHQLGIAAIDATFDARLTNAYDDAMAAGLWEGTYAATNAIEYWAEGTQSYFGANLDGDPNHGVHNHVDTRAELETYDRALFDLVDEVFGGGDPPATCPGATP